MDVFAQGKECYVWPSTCWSRDFLSVVCKGDQIALSNQMPSRLRLIKEFQSIILTKNEECHEDKILCYLCDHPLISSIARSCARHKYAILTKVYSYGVYTAPLFIVKLHGKPILALAKTERNWRNLDNVAQCLIWGVFFRKNSLLALDPETFRTLLQLFSLHHVNMCSCFFAPLLYLSLMMMMSISLLSL